MAANWQYNYPITGEAYGTTTTSPGPYAHTAAESPTSPVVASSVVIQEAGSTIATDDGNGNITGAGIASGSVNYTTGAITFTYTSAPTSGHALTVNYSASSINTAPANLDSQVYTLKQIMKQAGWTVPQSGTGSGGTFAASDLITSAGTGVGGISNNGAWFRIKAPTGTRELLFQRSTTTAGSWYIGVSNLGFTGTANGAVATSNPPTATDQHGLWGSTSAGASNTVSFQPWGSSTAGNYHTECAADANSPYGVYLAGFPKNSSTNNNATQMLIIDGLAANSYPASDADPYVYLCASNTNYSFGASFAGGTASTGVGVASINGTLSNNCEWLNAWPTNFEGNPYTGYDDL
jgi:hypothetical protein